MGADPTARPRPVAPPPPQAVQVPWKCNLTYHIVVWVYRGTARVHFDEDVAELRAGQAVWIPQRTGHMVEHDERSLALSILIPVGGSRTLGDERVFIDVPQSHTQWMFHLMLLTLSPLHSGQMPVARIVELLAQFTTGSAPDGRMPLPPLPRHPAARQVAARLLADKHCQATLAEFAARLKVNERTIRRSFSEDTGLPYRQWKSAARQAMADRGCALPPQPVPALQTRWMNFIEHDVILWAIRGRANVDLLSHAAHGSREHRHRLQAGQFLLVPHGHSIKLQVESGSLLFPLPVAAGSFPSTSLEHIPCQLPPDFVPTMLHRAIAHITLLRPLEFDRQDTLKLLELVPSYPGLAYPRDPVLRRIAEEFIGDLRGALLAGDVAERHGFSLRQLQRLWPEQTGMTLRAWRQAHRMQQADALLASGLGISRVTAHLGFTTPGNFARAYAQVRGHRPVDRGQEGIFGHSMVI